MTIITREQIDALPVHTIRRRAAPGRVGGRAARGVRGAQTDFAIRGATFGQMLVLVDGVRLNDAQSGHHNGDIPVPLDAVERIEILYGPGSSLFGADAFGGTVNVITRARSRPGSSVEGGSAVLPAERPAGVARGRVRQAVSASFDRSSGSCTTATSRRHRQQPYRVRRPHRRVGVLLWKEFGANGFYGNAPSREWTNQTLLAADHRVGTGRLGVRAGRVVSHARRPLRLQPDEPARSRTTGTGRTR